jgi:hypothetical protein
VIPSKGFDETVTPGMGQTFSPETVHARVSHEPAHSVMKKSISYRPRNHALAEAENRTDSCLPDGRAIFPRCNLAHPPFKESNEREHIIHILTGPTFDMLDLRPPCSFLIWAVGRAFTPETNDEDVTLGHVGKG